MSALHVFSKTPKAIARVNILQTRLTDSSFAMTNRRMVGLRMTDDELASFNRYLQANGYPSFFDFAHSLIQGRFTREELVQAVKEATDVNKSLQFSTFAKAETTNS